MPDQYTFRLDSKDVDKLPSETSLQEIADKHIDARRLACFVAECSLRTTIERNPVTAFGPSEDIDVVSVSCEDATCGAGPNDRRELRPTNAVIAGLGMIVSVHREIAKQQGTIVVPE